ncbi:MULTISPECIES: hypothetical protein [Streptomyces]|jgi:hypothetical protein|uniref:hypothetical protein n=1 Tax=Streptomyces TaxID=1883 RepID=UPI001164EB6A|nr:MULTISPECIES: hypothetical protein [Streptomyces]MCX4615917.1 hypothetical protein [Streptomyces mirabilis]MCX5347307.1 hypothetical protein [Streptomyces mirabilis]QDN86016.1 hypothetical protein FNV61_10745 [Streptomyces sp. RLB3-6]QDO06828.1 hypothetical protein FNV68_11850 [Streptomyces sp. S1D4-23]
MTQRQALEQSIRSLGGTWDAWRAVTALRDAGYGSGDRRQREKRARQVLRDIAGKGLIVKAAPDSATYRVVEQ